MDWRRLWPLHLYALAAAADLLSTYAGLLLVPGVEELNPILAGRLFTPFHAAYELAVFAFLLLLQLKGPALEERVKWRPLAHFLRGARKGVLAYFILARFIAALNNLYIISRLGGWP
ncbi:MAG: hypothetical protein QXR80_06405 [Desulfurococcaceae archaeon]